VEIGQNVADKVRLFHFYSKSAHFLLLESNVELFKAYMSFFTPKRIIAACLMNLIKIFAAAHINTLNDLTKTLAA